MIMFLLVAQAGEAFAVSSMACFGSGHKMMASDMMISGSTADEVSKSAMSNLIGHSPDARQGADEDVDPFTEIKQMTDHDCCQQDCDCPIGMLSIAVLIDLNLQAATHQSDDQLVDTDSSLVFTFIPSQQRPPKHLSTFAG